jgi:hypothetical protein
MPGSIQETIPSVLKTLWGLENELRSAAQNGVILRGDEARNHLEQARRHLDELLGLAQPPDKMQQEPDSAQRISTSHDNNKP